MPEITLRYKSRRTLDALKDFAKYFDFKILTEKKKVKNEKQMTLNGVTIIPANPSVKTTDLNKIFTGKNIDSSQLRNEAWRRKK